MKDKKMILLLVLIVFLFLTILGVRIVYDIQKDIIEMGNMIENNEETD
jgi:hypothetical protein